MTECVINISSKQLPPLLPLLHCQKCIICVPYVKKKNSRFTSTDCMQANLVHDPKVEIQLSWFIFIILFHLLLLLRYWGEKMALQIQRQSYISQRCKWATH